MIMHVNRSSCECCCLQGEVIVHSFGVPVINRKFWQPVESEKVPSGAVAGVPINDGFRCETICNTLQVRLPIPSVWFEHLETKF